MSLSPSERASRVASLKGQPGWDVFVEEVNKRRAIATDKALQKGYTEFEKGRAAAFEEVLRISASLDATARIELNNTEKKED